MLLGALRRISLMLLVVGGGTLVVSTMLALLAGASVRRTVAVSFYLVGSVLLIAGFFVGNRGVLRADSDSERPGFLGLSRGRVRSATSTEQRESTRVSALVIGLGVALLILGTFADNDHSLA
jgi:hypothetical protein